MERGGRGGRGAAHSGDIEAANKAPAGLWDNRQGSHLAFPGPRRLPEAGPSEPGAPGPPVTHLLPARAGHPGQGCEWDGRDGDGGVDTGVTSFRRSKEGTVRQGHPAGAPGTGSWAVRRTGLFSRLTPRGEAWASRRWNDTTRYP